MFRHLKIGPEKEERADLWVEYAGLFPENGTSSQIIDMGGVWRPVKRHQLDFRVGFGLTRDAPRAFLGFGWSWLPGKVIPFYGRPGDPKYRP